MGLVNKLKRLFERRAYRKAVENTGETIKAMVDTACEALTSYEVQDAVIDAIKANKVAIDAINWESLNKVVEVLKTELSKNEKVIRAFGEAAQANIDLMKSEFNSDEEEEV